MKALVLFLSLSFLTAANAGNRSYSQTFETTKNLEELIENITDYENTCMSGCTYYAPSVSRAKILDYERTENKFYIWVYIDDIKDSQSFNEINIVRENGTVIIKQTQVPAKLGNKLARLTGYNNNPLLKSNDVTAILTPLPNGMSQVVYSIKVSYSLILRPIGGRIYAALQEIVQAMEERLTK